VSATVYDEVEVTPDTVGVLYIWQDRSVPKAGNLGSLVPAAINAKQCGASTVAIELGNGRWLNIEDIRQLPAKWYCDWTSFVVNNGRVGQQRGWSGATFEIVDGDKLRLISDRRAAPASWWPLIDAGAAEALRQERQLVVEGRFIRRMV
jgi:hypothetical protein